MRHLLSLSDLGRHGLLELLDAAERWKTDRGSATAPRPLERKSVALVFEKASTRTRVSLEIAVTELGGHALVITGSGSQLARGEPIRDTTRVLTRMVHAMTFRTTGEQRLREMAEHSTVPVLNALTDQDHPMQLLADLQTVRAERGRLEGLKYAWIGDGNNMANSWLEAAGLLGLELRLACPEGYDPSAEHFRLAKERGAKLTLTRDALEAARGADVISTDVFASMGQEQETEKRIKDFQHMRVTQKLVAEASQGVMVLHCLPAHRGEEIDEEVLEGPRSFVWEQAEARLHTAKAALCWALSADA